MCVKSTQVFGSRSSLQDACRFLMHVSLQTIGMGAAREGETRRLESKIQDNIHLGCWKSLSLMWEQGKTNTAREERRADQLGMSKTPQITARLNNNMHACMVMNDTKTCQPPFLHLLSTCPSREVLNSTYVPGKYASVLTTAPAASAAHCSSRSKLCRLFQCRRHPQSAMSRLSTRRAANNEKKSGNAIVKPEARQARQDKARRRPNLSLPDARVRLGLGGGFLFLRRRAARAKWRDTVFWWWCVCVYTQCRLCVTNTHEAQTDDEASETTGEEEY
ncbi:hypothetical protein B0T19DRAFT_10775 [Cercophora scortea]|uniref:Uncharacterized protein n=1 Tax=Cercophora scortea TaxID=314031 RepID=A0AAE0MK36_9PEZI|nr:hypothetical protein B0T19DRAFT_10775 [Cercophora scortea]